MVSCLVYMLMIHTGERETLSIFFIGNVKNQNYLYCNSKTRHSCATSAYVFLAPVASVQSESFCICHSGAKSSPEVERERGSPCCGALLLQTSSRRPTTPPPPIELPMWHFPPSPLALLVRWNIPGDSHLLRQK